MQQRGQNGNDREGKTAGDEEVARLKSRVLDLGGRQDIEREPADEETRRDRLGETKLFFA